MTPTGNSISTMLMLGGTSPPDCMQDEKNNPWPDQKKQGKDVDNNNIWYHTHFSDDADPTEYIYPIRRSQ